MGPVGYDWPFAFPGDGTTIGMPDENKPGEDGFSSLVRSVKSMQVNVRSADSAAMVSYSLIGAIVVLGGVGYGLDRWLGTSPWLLLGGLLLGMIVGFYELAKAIFWRQ
jgi:Putative F0F1-ATPase subunit Ca2+/Mg2+ transporter